MDTASYPRRLIRTSKFYDSLRWKGRYDDDDDDDEQYLHAFFKFSTSLTSAVTFERQQPLITRQGGSQNPFGRCGEETDLCICRESNSSCSKPDTVLTGLSRLLEVKTYETKCNRLVIITKLVIIASQLNIEKRSKLLARVEQRHFLRLGFRTIEEKFEPLLLNISAM